MTCEAAGKNQPDFCFIQTRKNWPDFCVIHFQFWRFFSVFFRTNFFRFWTTISTRGRGSLWTQLKRPWNWFWTKVRRDEKITISQSIIPSSASSQSCRNWEAKMQFRCLQWCTMQPWPDLKDWKINYALYFYVHLNFKKKYFVSQKNGWIRAGLKFATSEFGTRPKTDIAFCQILS